MKQIILSLLLIGIISCNLSVITRLEGSGLIFDKPINYSIANFGLIPYGVRSTASLKLSNPINGCEIPQKTEEEEEEDDFNKAPKPQKNEEEEDEEKNKHTLKDLDQKKVEDDQDEYDYPQGDLPFVLIERGGCSFTQKALNAQAQGAKMAIIYDNDMYEEIQNIVLGDDGMGDSVNIPTIFISEKDGEKLKQLLDYKIMNTVQVPITMVIEFEVQKTEKVDLKFFINPPERANFELMNTFFSSWDFVKDKTTFTPVYEFYSCIGCEDSVNCIRNGRYCAIDMDGDQAGTGRQVAEEYLYQLCLQKVTDTKKWWDYVKYQHQHCHQIANQDKCSRQFVEDNIQYSVKQCMYSFDSDINSDKEIPILEKNNQIREFAGVVFFPSVTINNAKYRGSIFGEDVLEATCATLQKPSKECKKIIDKTQSILEHKKYSEGPNVTIIIVVVSVVLFLFFLFMVVIYRRMITKTINKEMDSEVNQMVSQYIAFYESKDSSRVASQPDNQELA